MSADNNSACLSSTLVASCCIKHRKGENSSWASDFKTRIKSLRFAVVCEEFRRFAGSRMLFGCCPLFKE